MNKPINQPSLILASSSPYRRELLDRLEIPFTCESPDIDETVKINETAQDLVVRLATEKAAKIADNNPASIIIGSDQVATLHDEILAKPENHEQAVLQLRKMSDQSVVFSTGLCVMNSSLNTVQSDRVTITVKFRKLGDDEIERYLRKEQPYHCAGSFKSEGLGITLLEYLRGDDPSALIGLPLIRLCQMLRAEGLVIP